MYSTEDADSVNTSVPVRIEAENKPESVASFSGMAYGKVWTPIPAIDIWNIGVIIQPSVCFKVWSGPSYALLYSENRHKGEESFNGITYDNLLTFSLNYFK